MNAKNSIVRTQNRRVVIRTPFPTAEETADFYGISRKRLAELRQMAAEIRAEDERREERAKKRAAKAAKKK